MLSEYQSNPQSKSQFQNEYDIKNDKLLEPLIHINDEESGLYSTSPLLQNQSSKLYKETLLKLNKDISFIENNPIQYHNDSNKLAIIIDPRFDPIMEAVIRNFMYFMNPQGWNLLIISYSGYIDDIKKKFPNTRQIPIDDTLIHYDENNLPNISINIYNQILLNIDLWKSLKEQHICIFQKDCIMFKMFNEYFNFYDFAGANYYRREHCSFLLGGINGGFSLRNRNTMIECLEKITWDKIVEYRKEYLLKLENETIFSPLLDTMNEDVFFTYACEMLCKEVPDKLHRTFLSIEADFNFDASVYHGWHHNYHDKSKATTFLIQSPLFCNYIDNIDDNIYNNAD